MAALKSAEKELYSRQLLVEGFDENAQVKVKQARILVIGAGGLGSAVIPMLTAAGVGNLGIVEYDRVELSNLNRQILYSVGDIGKPKADVIHDKLKALNPSCKVKIYRERWSEENAEKLSDGYDLLIDCTDNYAARHASDAVSKRLQIPLVYGAVNDLEGQVAVFNYKGSKGYRELFRKVIEPELQHQGVLGPIAGVIGNMQVAEALKIITGYGELLTDKLCLISLKHNRFQVVAY